jgi:predicted kinase
MQEFKPITTKAARKYRDVPGYEESLLIDEIETGKRGIFDLIREYKPDSGVPLAAYINKFLPARAIEAAKRILKTEFTEDVTERVDIAAEEVTPEVKTKRKPKKIVLADRLGIKDKVYRSIDKILSDLNLNELTFKTLKNQIPEITGKLFGIDPKKIVNKANITKSELQSSQMFISKNADLLISMLPEGATASGTATGVPKSLLQAFYTKTGRAKMAKTGTKAGLAIQQKRKINRKEFLETFGIIDGKPVRTDRNTSARVLALADTLGKMITNQAVRQRAEGLTIEAVNRLKDGKSGVMFSKNNVKEITSDVNKKNPQFFKLANVPDVNGKPQQQLPKGPVLIQKINEKGEVTFTEGSIKLMDSLWDVDQGITWGQHMSNRINNFLDSHPEYYNILQELLTGGVKRTAYMTVDNFQALIPKTEKIKKADQIVNERLDYHRTLTTKEKEAGLKGKRLRKNIETLDRSKDKNKLNNLIKFFQDMSNYLNKDNGKNMTDLWLMDELLKHSSVDQNNFFRKSAQLLGYPIDDNGNPITNQIVVEEHTPINEVIKIAMGSAIRGKVKNIKPLLESLLSQISILDVDDPSGSLKASLGKDFYSEVLPRIVNGDLKLKPGHAGIYRLMKHGVNPFRYKLLESGNTIAQEFGVDNLNIDDARQRIIDYFEGKVSLEYNKAMSKVPFARDSTSNYRLSNAISSGRNPSFSMSSKGITVLDFDDTLATTKSGVRARIPNPDGTPKPKRKAVLLAGGAGSGKSNVVKQLGLEEQGFKIVNQDISLEWLKKNNGLPTDMKDLTKEQMSMLGKLGYQARMIAKRKYGKFKGQGDGVIIDGTGGSVKTIQTQKTELEAAGYDVQMLFVETSLEVAQERNKNRKERSLSSSIVRRNHEAVQKNKPEFKKIFGEGFTEVNTDNLKQNDPMPKSVSKKISNFVTSYEKRRLDAEEFALEGADILEKGGEFDFSEFNKVVEGKIAPLFQKALKLQKKFGNKDMFVLTARPAESQQAIFEFLKANGLNIPLENITGLANSTPEAKALWMADKVADGYNDFYFADDALQNVQAVKNILDQFDVKSKVQQAKAMFSKNLDKNFNDILEEVTGIDSKKRFSDIKARKRGESKGKFRFFIPPSHEDFVGLLYNFMGKGRKGDAHRDFFEQALVRPLNRAYREIDAAKQAVANDYKSLNKQFPEIKKKLTKKTPDGDFTYQDAIRVYLWDKHGYDIPGLSPTDRKNLVNLVNNDSNLKAYSDALNILSKQEAYVDPGPNWETGNIRIDLVDATGRVGRASYFTEFNENADIIFSPENLNKIEAAYGKAVKEALEDMLHRIKTGINRPKGASAKPNMFMNWLNASVSGVMFFNTRSALLQQMSNVNYLNFADNNIFAAGKAFANQKQYWNDFAMIFNSDMLKQRRGGLQTDINGAELAEAIKKARPGNIFDQVAIITGKALRLGFLPTQIGDNIAIATGGAAFYRNRVNKYIKDGLSEKEAESKAWIDFSNITQTTQQSALPHMTSQQQAMWIGKLVLNFLNTPSQYNRIIKKSGSDIINRRITPPNTTQMQSDMSNMSRILYYGAAQNLIFYSLQTALFAVMFGLGDEDEEKNAEQILKKKERVINGAIDTILRGSGIYGVAVSTLKNMMIKFLEQREKGYNKDESAVIMEALNFSPVVGIKARKIVNAEKTLNYNKKIIDEMETFDIDNPMWSAVTNYIEVAGPPANRIYQKTINLRNASDNQYTAFQRAMFLSGYTTWSLGLGDTQKMKDVKEKIKKEKKKTKKSPFKPRFKPKY